ncbi:DUF4397 domain-containing protein [Echinicola jeungdonensis]|uniref:DUF4397 domain-containing protein n=1 Tax=Echinicola jeungdonensis TaxID=709343 RepID=A0ABV5J1B8_9BACT|nr:DUF4397 domain-containing protein [Echinicola jeungdonensis]MDN3668450.1 DUF4397 domain-containing protein [Echinicola jeungdonensis]
MLTQLINIADYRKWKINWALLLLAMSPIIMSSCLDDDDVEELPPAAYVSYYHGAPNFEAITIYADGNQYNTNLFEFSDYFIYSRFYTGDRDLSFRLRNTANSLLDTTVNFIENQAYSFFLTEENDQLQTVIAEDNWDSPENTNALVRLVHLSPDAPAVSLKINDEETDLFENQSFQDVTDFEEITAAPTNLTLKNADNGEVLLTAENINLRNERVYTIVVRGYASPEEGAPASHELSLQLIRNYPDF